jgi:hypothetical protein
MGLNKLLSKNHKLEEVLRFEKIGDNRLKIVSVNDKNVIEQL